MFLAEYETVKDYSYDRYCRYLTDKYGRPEYDFFNPKCKRPSEGLEVHHVKEDEIPDLCDRKVAALYDKSFQAPENLVYCDYLEHLFLHILIGEKTAGGKNIGLNGAFFHIIPAIKSYYDGEKGRYNDAYYKRLDGCEDVFDLLIGRYNKLIEETNVVFDTNVILYRQMEDALNTKGRALVVLGTGLGKTTTALNYLWKHKCRALVVCPSKLIESGWKERYSEWCDTVSFIGLAHSYKKIDYSKYGVVIVDEAHHAGYDEKTDSGAKVWSKGIEYILGLGVKVIGLTATPDRTDAINIGKTIFEGCVCEGCAVEDAIDDGIVYPFSYISALYDAPAIAEEYKDCQSRELVGQLDVAINNTPTLKEIFAENMPAGERKGIIFIQDIADEGKVLEIVKDVFPDAEYRTIHSSQSDNENSKNKEWFEQTRSGYLLAVNMISEGAHYPGVNTLIMFRRTSSYLVYTQQLGRIITLTKDPDPHAIVFDLVNNVENVVYNAEKVDKNTHSVRRVYEAIKRQAEKSTQIIIRDETRDIVECIRRIKIDKYDYWETWETDWLRLRYEVYGPDESARQLNALRGDEKRTRLSVLHKASKMGLRYYHPIYNNYFSVDEEEWLLQNYKKGAAFCKKHLNRPYNSMWRILKKHNLSFPSKKIFTDEIVNLLMGDKTDKEISAITGIDEIKIRNKRIALGKSKVKYHRNKWTQVEDDILKEVFPKEGGKCCFRFDNKTEEEVRRRAKCLGIKRDKTSRYNGMCKTILCVEKNITFTSVKDAAIFAGISRNNISAAVNQKNKTAGGYHWEFVDEEKELIERSMQTKTVKKICDLIKKHTLQTSVDSREDRDLLCQKLFRLMEKFKKEDNSVFLSHLFDGDLYCYTTLSFSALKRINKRDSVYLCCSKEIDSFNPMCRCFDPYKFFYRFQTKKGSINIDANSFLKEHQRQHENEVIVALSDIVQVDELRMFREFGKTKISGYHWKQSDEEKQG